MARMTGAQAAIAALHAHGVDTVFGIPGVHTLPLYDAMRSTPGIRHILARHEQGAGFMAEGYARASGRVGVACTITGPGVTNIATPMASAYADSIPLFVLSTSLPRRATRRPMGLLHEVKDQLGVMESLSGWTRVVESVEEIPDAIYDAFRQMLSGRPRGSYLQIPLDLLELEAEVNLEPPAAPVPLAPPPARLAEAAALLRAARRPVILAGAGVTFAGGNAALRELAELLQAPVLLGSKSRDVLPTDCPLVIATNGYSVPEEVRYVLEESDVALVVGSKLGVERMGWRRLPVPEATIHVDIDPSEIGRQYPVRIAVVADARLTVEALVQALTDDPGSKDDRQAHVDAAREAVLAEARRSYGATLQYLDAVRAALPPDGVVVADMTMLGYASTEYFTVTQPRTFVHPSELCTIGCALPTALGARVAGGSRPVVAICGDGGFLLNTGEMASAVQERIGVIVLVFNDSTYTAVKDNQRERFDGRYIATDLTAPDFVALARAFGANGRRVDSPPSLREELVEALGADGPTLIEVPIQRAW
jgi:acetolactate synthase-1/2/3 large subunit